MSNLTLFEKVTLLHSGGFLKKKEVEALQSAIYFYGPVAPDIELQRTCVKFGADSLAAGKNRLVFGNRLMAAGKHFNYIPTNTGSLASCLDRAPWISAEDKVFLNDALVAFNGMEKLPKSILKLVNVLTP